MYIGYQNNYYYYYHYYYYYYYYYHYYYQFMNKSELAYFLLRFLRFFSIKRVL